VKPGCQFESCRFPRTDSFFQASGGRWHGWDDNEPFRRHNLGREYLIEAARERAKEMAAFAVILVAAAWPVIYMLMTIWQVLHRQQPSE
jgi:hypothetical protein